MIGRLLDKLTADVPDEKTAMRRGWAYAYSQGIVTLDELEAAQDAIEKGETFAHVPSEPFDPDDDRGNCVVCGMNASICRVGTALSCPACDSPAGKARLKERDIIR
jgi:hypothetical protein